MMDVKAATNNKVEDNMSESWLELIDQEENALLDEAVSHTIRQLSAELRSNGCGDREISKPVQSCLRINSDNLNNGAESPNRNEIPSWTEDDPIDAEEDGSNQAARKRPREDSVNSLPAKISRNRHNSTSSSSTNSSSTSKNKSDLETDPATLARRQKDIDYGKNTIGYDRYIQAVPKKDRTKEHPNTPPKYVKYSRRGWDGMVKLWRKQLHTWDPTDASSASIVEDKDRPTE